VLIGLVSHTQRVRDDRPIRLKFTDLGAIGQAELDDYQLFKRGRAVD
jgi:hypothetical protein